MESHCQSSAAPPDLKLLMVRALDMAGMLQIFQRELPALADTPIRVIKCRARVGKAHAVPKQGELQVTYRVFVESVGGQKRPYDLWGTLPVMPAFLSPELLECCRAALGHPAVVPFERLAVYIPELHMGVQFLPVDLALPALIETTRPDGGQLVAPFMAECQNGATLEQTCSELLHYKPGTRCVLKFTVQLVDAAGNPHQRVVFGKLFADDRGAAIYRDMQTLWEVACRSACLHIPEPLGYDSERRMLLMAEAPGQRDLNAWAKCLEEQQPLPPGVDLGRLERCMVVVAAALHELHRSGIHPGASQTFHEALTKACKDLEPIRHAHPALAQEIGRILERLQMHVPHNERLVPCHGGFRHKQLMGNDQYLTLLDWDGLTLAHPALDAASFLRRLRHVPITEPGKAGELEWLAEVFRHEFLACEPEVPARDLALYEALVLIDMAMRAFRRPKRREHVVAHMHRLVAEAERLLDRQEN
jgi:Phosphotransferase enzyme family